jgi:hypothetical protein
MHLQGVADPANHVAAPRRQPRVQVERRAPAQPKVRAHDLPAPGGQFVPVRLVIQRMCAALQPGSYL